MAADSDTMTNSWTSFLHRGSRVKCSLSLVKFCLMSWLSLLLSCSSTNHVKIVASAATVADLDLVAQKFIVPHDVYPGFAITKFNAGDVFYRLLESELSQLFAVVENGLFITTGDISHLADQEVSLVVAEEHPDHVVDMNLKVYILNSSTKLRFPSEVLSGKVQEHSPVGTVVSGLDFITARRNQDSKKVQYEIVSGNEEGTFRLEDVSVGGEEGVRLVVNTDHLDREIRDGYTLVLRANDSSTIDMAEVKLKVMIEDINDHAPMFDREDYFIRIMLDTPRFTPMAQVRAYDADGDKVIYKMTGKSSVFFVVPKTGEVFLIGEPQPKSYDFEVMARDDRTPTKYSAKPAQIHIEVSTGIMLAEPQPTVYETNHLNLDGLLEHESLTNAQQHSTTSDLHQRHQHFDNHLVSKRHVKRSVRPTKTVEYRETDGHKEGQVVFRLENETGREKFQLRDDNIWVIVDPSGEVRVKKKWDYEELGAEKSIDFWVTITNTHQGGKLWTTPFTVLVLRLFNLNILS